MYRELIEEAIKDNKWAKLNEPCPENEISNAEKFIGYKFPDELKELLRELNGDNWFLLSAQQMVKHVKTNREIFPEYLDEEDFIEKVDRHIFFATNGCGDYYCYRILENGETDTSAIYIWEHELFETRPVAKDIKDAIIKYYNEEI